MLHSSLKDSPITAVECSTGSGVIYFAAGNAVYRSTFACEPPSSITSPTRSSAGALPSSTTTLCVAAPSSTVITTLAVAPVGAPVSASGDAQNEEKKEQTIVLMGAADHLLIFVDRNTRGKSTEASHADSLTPLASRTTCLCVLQAAESRILRIAVDVMERVVLALTAANDLFYLALDEIVHAWNSATNPGYKDVSRSVLHRRVRGPSLGVVLAADILLYNCPRSDSGSSIKFDSSNLTEEFAARTELAVPSCRLFAATYAGEVVEWCPAACLKASKEQGSTSDEGVDEQSSLQADPCCVVSRVQAHRSGCAIFAVRVVQQRAPCLPSSPGGDEATLAETHVTHLATCSDDRTVTLFQRCCHGVSTFNASNAYSTSQSLEDGWSLLWRGSGAAFSKSRIFDVAVCVLWPPVNSLSPQPSSPDVSRTCAVHVAAAGEDGSVQVHRIEAADASTAVRATCCFVRARQHRGHGAYRVAFCAPTAAAEMTVVSGGFDGTVFAHTYPIDELSAVGGEAACAVLDTSEGVRQRGGDITGAEEEERTGQTGSSASAKAAQVRVVHVDAAGHVLACTSQALCVQYRGNASVRDWRCLLPGECRGSREGDASAAAGASTAVSYGLPACAESVSFALQREGQHVGHDKNYCADVSCVIVGTTAGAVYALPYACTSADGSVTHPAKCESAETIRSDDISTLVSEEVGTTALHVLGKITSIALLSARSLEGQQSTVFVATNHVRHAVVLSALHVEVNKAFKKKNLTASGTQVCMTGAWHHLSVWRDCPGPLTTSLSLLPASFSPGTHTLMFWLLIGDKNGRLSGVHRTVSDADLRSDIELDTAPASATSPPLPVAVSITEAAAVRAYVFPERMHIAIAALCAEASAGLAITLDSSTLPQSDARGLTEPLVLRITGTGGVVEFFRLPDVGSGVAAGPFAHPSAPSREPLRLPFDVSSVLALSSRVCVVQSGTTVSVLYRVPGQSAWVLVDAHEEVRAPRLLTARICDVWQTQFLDHGSSREAAAGPVVYLAHCSDGHRVESLVSFPDQPRRAAPSAAAAACVRTSLLHGAGLPGKDYNCVAYAPAPLHGLLLGNEDSSLVVYPLSTPASPATSTSSLLRRFVAPLNICGAHHSNILAMAVLPQPTRKGGDKSEELDDRFRFVSVGGGAMVNVWASDNHSSPLRLLDWWCGGVPSANLQLQSDEDDGDSTRRIAPTTASVDMRGALKCGRASLQKKRVKQALSSPACALAERIARFMCVTALDSNAIAVGSSDGTLLFLSLAESEVPSGAVGDEEKVDEALQLVWQGVLNAKRPKPILCISSSTSPKTQSSTESGTSGDANQPAPGLLVAGDTNGIVYVVDAATHCVAAQLRLEQSAVNALSAVHAVPTDNLPDAHASSSRRRRWRCAAVHDSGVVHLLQIDATLSTESEVASESAFQVVHAAVTVLSSASTGLTAGRAVCWPHASEALVAVTEERVTYFDARHLQRGVLAVSFEQRVNVRCVSGAVVVPGGICAGATATASACTELLPRVAVVGQGFEVVGG